MNTLARMAAPEDLRTAGVAPRAKSRKWRVGDLVQIGSARWIIRIVDGRSVELEASNIPAGIWWRTTLDKLPEKSAR